ncbi:PAS domain-containing sensor histidine kinase [Methanolobus sp. ZRKC3]|uniref:sensor histidine kinase n=1 Tax=Methanolobus sp. ZRKC3 TaxID=3125786 RepID=UPI0032467E3C
MHIPLKSLLKGILSRIPPACQFPEIAEACITLDDDVYHSENYKNTPWNLSVDIVVHGKVRGNLRVVYLEERPVCDIGPFLKEDKKLLDIIVSRLCKVVERKTIEDALLDSEKRYRVIFESSPLGIFIDKDGIITHCNKSLSKIFDTSRDQIIGAEVSDFVSDERLEQSLFSSHSDIFPYYESEYSLDLDEETVYLKSYYVPRRSMDNKIEGGVCLIADITKDKLSEDALYQQKELLSSTFNALQDLIVVVDRDLRVVTSNWKSDLSVPVEKRDGHPHCYNCFMKREAPCDPCYVKGVFSTGDVAEIERENPADGKIMEYRAFPVFDKNNDVVMAVEHIRDITERKITETALKSSTEELEKAYEELQSLDKLKDEFLSNLRHELNTPLTSIRGFSELLHDGTFGPLTEKQLNAIGKVVDKSKSLQSLIDSLLFASSSQSGKVKYRFERILLNDIINTSLHQFSTKASGKNISISNDYCLDAVYVNGDADYLPRVFMNLLDNAIKFTPDNGNVKFSVFCEDGNLRITVEDDGIGIPEEYVTNLFHKFYQIDSSSTRSYGGNGLGLYVSKVIVEDHGGKIWLESEKGVGTKVHVELPGE